MELHVRDGDASRSSFIIQYCLGYPEFFVCLFVFLYEVEYCVRILMGIALNLSMTFGRIAIFTMLIPPIQEHRRSFHFLVSSSISFIKDLNFLSNRSFTSFISVTPRYFVLCVAIVKVDASLISLSVSLSFMYRRATDFFF